MPLYTYYCESCKEKYELFFNLSDYIDNPKCADCKKKMKRSYQDDIGSLYGAVKKTDSELKTIGDLANRNSDKLSDDEKIHLYKKHNNYKENIGSELPSGMSRIKKPQKKIKWT